MIREGNTCPTPMSVQECKPPLNCNEFAEARGADAIFIGVQSLDYSGYPDCRPQFIELSRK